MKVPVELTPRGLRALERAARVVCQMAELHQLAEDFDVTALRRTLAPMRRAVEAAGCVHCGLRDGFRANGLCDRCHVYEVTYGQRPAKEVLVRTLRRTGT